MNVYTFRGNDFAILICSSPEVSFHMEPPWVWGTKVPSNDLNHMTERVATPIFGEFFFCRNGGLIGRFK